MPQKREPHYIAGIAQDLRERAKLRRPIYSPQKILERLRPGTQVTGDRLGPGLLGLTRVQSGCPTIILYRRGLSASEIRVVLAHELGHLELEDLSDGTRTLQDHEVGGWEHGEVALEQDCDLFAAELLAPLAQLDREVSDRMFPSEDAEGIHWWNGVDALCDRFGVPLGWMKVRLWDLRALRLEREMARNEHEIARLAARNVEMARLRAEAARQGNRDGGWLREDGGDEPGFPPGFPRLVSLDLPDPRSRR